MSIRLIAEISLVLFLVFSFVIFQNIDYNEKVEGFKQYCLDVKENIYPDYKNMIDHCED